MIRNIVEINEEKCNGCGACADACHEGAIQMINGKAKLIRDDYCDGLGNCLPACPVDAIKIVRREAAAFNEEEVLKNMQENKVNIPDLPCGCPGTQVKELKRNDYDLADQAPVQTQMSSQLRQWPVQIKLVPINAPYFDGANLLIAADCTAFAYADFHNKFIKNHIALIGCPKLDEGDYSEKLTAIIKNNNIKSVKVVRMEVPCCAGIANAAMTALQNSGKFIPWQVITVSTDGIILED